jgi:hypothetical protein
MASWSKPSVLMLTVVLLTSSLVIVSSVAPPVHAEPTWTIQTVDANGARWGYGGICPIVVDSNNNPHIAYLAPPSGSKVKYASSNGSLWTTQTIDAGNAYSLVLDANDNPHILYTGLMYASWTGLNWAIQRIDETFSNGFGSVALDSFGNPHVAYTDGKAVKYARWTGSDWTSQTVDTYSEIPHQLSLALDKNNTPYILYDNTVSILNSGGGYYHSEKLKLATLQNSSWSIQTVASSGGFGNMVLDSKGNPHLIYKLDYPEFVGVDNSTLVYASWDGTAWATSTVASNIHMANVGFLALDSFDYPHIAYVIRSSDPITDEGITVLSYASWTGKNWSIQTADTNISAIGPCYLALDSNGNPHISYLGYNPDAGFGPHAFAYIMYATTNQTTPIIRPSPTQTSSPTFPASLLPVLTLVIIGIIVAVVVYVWKKKHKALS